MDVHGLVVGTNKDEYDSEGPLAVAVADFVCIQNLINRYHHAWSSLLCNFVQQY